LDQEDKLRALVAAVDYRRSELRGAGDEADARCELACTAVAANLHRIAVRDLRQDGFRNIESDLEIAGRKQRRDRPARRHHLAGTEIDLLDSAGDRARNFAAREPRRS